MTNPNAPEFVLSAVKRIYNDLPQLIGLENWNTVSTSVDDQIAAIQHAETPEQRLLPSTQLFGALAQYEPARQKLATELKIQETISANIQTGYAQILPNDTNMPPEILAELYSRIQWEIDEGSLPKTDEDVTKLRITMKPGGDEGGKILKFTKVKLDTPGMMTMAGGLLFTVSDVIDKPILIAAGVLVVVGTLLNNFGVDVSQQEATVFWGFLVAASHKVDKQATEERILRETNDERENRTLDPLSEKQFKHSLTVLQRLEVIKHVKDDIWQIIDEFHIKD